ncbi:hypothetical protein [Flavobacterium sp. LB2P53]|uniref:hypothetical protein n=1 Tax=Flavobacterium sp. LB2P53 TaxID=2497481 RepID=UPI000F82167E|nr:hypothetical protein [Flavobacterium sp. LB2P53]RTY69687.1 hypothetical protein EKL95_05875 [Flavobacterium sp. LB2P53]
MKIKSITGVTKSDEITITKSIGSLIIAVDGLALDALTTEKISVYIERGNGSNVILANKVLLVDFILASTFGGEATQSDSIYETIAVCELAVDGGIFLAEKESIKIVLEDLIALKTYDLYGIEEPTLTNQLYHFEQKTVASEEFSKKVDVLGFDLAIMTVHSSISDLSYKFVNGQIVKYLPFELQSLSRDIDPIQAINGTAVSQGVSSRLSLPLLGVDSIEINKSQGAVINFVVRTVKNVE